MSDPYLPNWREVVEIEAGTFIARPLKAHPAYELFGFRPVERAYEIAVTAHAALGQTRADKVTPYIVHPLHVAALAYEWAQRIEHLIGCEARCLALPIVAVQDTDQG